MGSQFTIKSDNSGLARVPGTGERSAGIVTFARYMSPERARPIATAARVSDATTKRAEAFAGMVGESQAMQVVYEHLRRVGPADITVTIVGESGTGKELAARALHDLSPRRQGPFVAVNCGAIPANLAEAEIFGYEKGAFTGAARQHAGHFERADGGTLFLDEFTEMPLEMQVKLLRVLETGRLIRVGGSAEIEVDVRVVAATNRDPMRAVRDGRLREDLYYRIVVFPLELPPLRAREDDVVLIAQALLEGLNAKYSTSKAFGAAALTALRSLSWPGNVRELRNWVERAYILADRELTPPSTVAGITVAPGIEPDGCIRVPVGSTFASVEKEMIIATVRHCEGNKHRAADVLGITPKAVYDKLTEYGLRDRVLPLGNTA